MAKVKISESQRKYFANRINEEFNAEIRILKQQEAKNIQDLASTNTDEYIKTLGLTTDIRKFKKLEERYEESKKKLNTIINNMEQLDPTESEIKNQYNFYGTCTVWKYEDVEKYFSMKCNQVARDHYRKKNDEVARLENKRRQAIDHVYGMTEHNEIVRGLTTIFKDTNVKFLLEEAK